MNPMKNPKSSKLVAFLAELISLATMVVILAALCYAASWLIVNLVELWR